ncbi:MAG: D-alanine--D-alanine ligase [Sphaerochaetaceae bacterium]|nr:D-alanine--D-alanine ligase [Sphaerochaetaceae bacterium]
MMNIALVYGGRSTEHEVSVNSAKSVFRALTAAGYGITCIGIAKDGTWHLQDPSLTTDALPGPIVPKERDGIYIKPGEGLWNGHMKLNIDAVLPVAHGTEGEDGRLQSLCDLAHLPCVGCDAPSSTFGMHKEVAKRLFATAGIPVVPSILLTRDELSWLADDDDADLPQFIASFIDRKETDHPLSTTRQEMFQATVMETLGNSIVVKPEAGGSSVGVTILDHLGQEQENSDGGTSVDKLLEAIATAAEVCDSVLLETLVAPMQEVECAVLETPDEGLVVGGPGMVHDPRHAEAGFLSYAQKYGDDQPATMRIPAPISEEDAQMIRHYAKLAFKAIGANGYARVDFFIIQNINDVPSALHGERILLNEINTLPGMTSTSHYPRLIAPENYDMPTMLQVVIEEAIKRYKRTETMKHTL